MRLKIVMYFFIFLNGPSDSPAHQQELFDLLH